MVDVEHGFRDLFFIFFTLIKEISGDCMAIIDDFLPFKMSYRREAIATENDGIIVISQVFGLDRKRPFETKMT